MAQLTRIDESFMPDTCEIRVRPGNVNGSDFGGGDDNNDTSWSKLPYTHADGSTDNVIPARVGTRPQIRAQRDLQGAETTLYTYTVAIPIVMLGAGIKPGDHIHWAGVIIEVAEERIGSYSTSYLLMGERLY